MFWIMLMAVGLAILTMTIKLLSVGLKLLLLIGAVLGVVYVVRWLRRE